MKLLFLFLFVIPIVSFSQYVAYDSSAYVEIVHVDSVSKDELFKRARSWFAVAFKSANNVIQLEDREAGKIIGKGASKYTAGKRGLEGWIFFMITVETKDGRFRVLIENLRHESADQNHSGGSFDNKVPECGDFKLSIKKWEQLRETAYGDIINLVNNLKADMQKKIVSDNW